MILMRRKVEKKKMKITGNVVISMLAGTVAQLVQKARDTLMEFCSIAPLRVFIKLNISFKPAVI